MVKPNAQSKSGGSNAGAATPVPTPAPLSPQPTPAPVPALRVQGAIPTKQYGFLQNRVKVEPGSDTVPPAANAPEVRFQYTPHII